MTIYKAVIKPLSSFVSPLQNDTLFGAFCWSYSYKYGEDELLKLIESCQASKPPIIFSCAFPQGFLPLPFGIFDASNDYQNIVGKSERQKAYQANKKVKNARYVSLEIFNNILNGNYANFKSGVQGEQTIEAMTMHNMVDRMSDTVQNIDGAGSLFEKNELFAKAETRYDVYMLSSLPTEVLEGTLSLMFDLGIGGDKSTGKGSFALQAFEVFKGFNSPAKANGFIALSNFIPKETDPVNGSYKTFVKYPRVDREFAQTETPFKKPLLFLKSGSVFKDAEPREFYGSCISNVSPISHNIITNAFTIAVGAVVK